MKVNGVMDDDMMTIIHQGAIIQTMVVKMKIDYP
jgi:hypothetical protein